MTSRLQRMYAAKQIPTERPDYIGEKLWRCLVGHIVEPRGYQEIAAKEGIGIAAVRERVSLALIQLEAHCALLPERNPDRARVKEIVAEYNQRRALIPSDVAEMSFPLAMLDWMIDTLNN